MSLFLNVPVDFKIVQYHLSNLRKDHVVLSNLRAEGYENSIQQRGSFSSAKSLGLGLRPRLALVAIRPGCDGWWFTSC